MALQYPYRDDRYTLIGTVTRSHGLKGEFKVSTVSSFWELPETLEQYSRVALVATDGRMTELLDIETCRVQGKQVILKLDSIDSKNEADLIASMGVLVSFEDLSEASGEPKLQPHRLVGSPVFTTTGNLVGKLVDVRHTGGHPLLIITDGKEEYLVPLVDEIVVSIDEQRMVIDPPAGLLEINQPDQCSK
jgi:16S rRNA processing protein RimM